MDTKWIMTFWKQFFTLRYTFWQTPMAAQPTGILPPSCYQEDPGSVRWELWHNWSNTGNSASLCSDRFKGLHVTQFWINKWLLRGGLWGLLVKISHHDKKSCTKRNPKPCLSSRDLKPGAARVILWSSGEGQENQWEAEPVRTLLSSWSDTVTAKLCLLTWEK